MRDLAEAGRSVVDAPAVPPTPLDQIETRARDRRRRGRARAAGALVIAVALVGGAVAVAYDRSTDHPNRQATKPGVKRHHPVKARQRDIPLLVHRGVLHVPKGWKPVDYGAARLWVPADWTVTAGGCTVSGPGVIELGGPYKQKCAHEAQVRSFVSIRQLEEQPYGFNRQVINGFAVYTPGGSKPSDQWSVPDLHVTITATGKDSQRVITTLSPSARRIALARPAEKIPGTWHRVSYQGISIAVPSEWRVHLKADTYSCQQFVASNVLVGTPNLATDCPYEPQSVFPQDGAFLAAPMVSDPNAPGRDLVRKPEDGIRVRALAIDPNNPSPVLNVVATIQQHPQLVEIGLGPDGRVANAILHSIKRVPSKTFVVPGCAPTFETVHNTEPMQPMVPAGPTRALLCVYEVARGAHLKGASQLDTARFGASLNNGRPIGACTLGLVGWAAVLHFDYADARPSVSVVVGSCTTGRGGSGSGRDAVATPPQLLSEVNALASG